MFQRNKLLFVLSVSTFVFTIFYACVSKKSQKAIDTTEAGNAVSEPVSRQPRVLVFTRTKGFYHQSIPVGAAAIVKLGTENNFKADTTADANYFVEDSLKHYAAVVFLNTTQNVLNGDQQVAFERYIQAGGGYAGVHAAADTEYDWPWYNKLAGAYFLSHPKIQKAIVLIKDNTHPSTSFLPAKWERTDEWYNYKNISPDIKVLATVDETSYQGGVNGDNHPIAWYHAFDGGRSFYTGLGHTNESYNDPLYLRHLLEGIRYAIGNNVVLNYSKSYAVRSPDDNRFTKTILSNDLNEPMELTVAPDGRVFFTERAGNFYMYDPVAKQTRLLRKFPAKAVDKYLNGLIGITLDPDFSRNNYLYFFYSSSRGEQYKQNISRFTLNSDGFLDTLSEKIIIEVPIDLEVSAHTGGSLAWDKHKNLFISTGDNTVPFESNGYAPLDERAGRHVYDAQRSAGNPNDLRGKILRIHPEADGSYTVPEGNLFPKGTPGTKPEIYVMGCRNPYRIAVDTATSILYWGEVGPDAGRDAAHAPRGYDEFNQARTAGYYGWPYFIGDSKPYHDSDFAAKTVGALYDVNGPENNSPNNTGAKKLPPARKAMLWYPYDRSTEFPELGDQGRCAMGGPIYHYNASSPSVSGLPAYYDKAWFVYDWMRNWVIAVRLDENSNYKRMERFMPTNGDFRRPVDMEFGPDGVIYMLEYGSVYGIDNQDARLVRIDYNSGNRAPVAQINARDTIGLAPYKVAFNSSRSYDFNDEDKLSYEWRFEGNSVASTASNPVHTFEKNGVYKAVLKITDAGGLSSTDTLEIKVGNTLPVVNINTASNSTFFFNKSTALNYDVVVRDSEDDVIDKSKIKVGFKYIPKVAGNEPLVGHQQISETYNLGKNLMATSDCKACHQLDAKSVGPAFMNVSIKYKNDKNAVGYLANKVITGGGGVWGEHAMNAHPQLSKEEATEIVKYVLSVSNKDEDIKLSQKGMIVLNQHLTAPDDGRYLLNASYTDKGGAITPLTTRAGIVLRPAKVQAVQADILYNIQRQNRRLSGINHRSYLVLKNIDLKEVDSITYNYSSKDMDASIEVHTDSLKGKLVSKADYKSTTAFNQFANITAPITDPGGRHDLYIVFIKNDEPNKNLASLNWIRFEGGQEVLGKRIKSAAKVKSVLSTVQQPSPKAKPAAKPVAAKQLSPAATAGRNLMDKSDCKVCHAPDKKLIGPSFIDIATKYKGQAGATDRLADKVISGGSGVWGDIPMTPHPQISKKDAAQMVSYILSVKK